MMRTLTIFILGLLFASHTAWGALPLREGEFRFRLGPFFEYASENGTNTCFAIRPFFSRVHDPRANRSITDVVWPLTHDIRTDTTVSGRVATVFYRSNTSDPERPDWTFSIPPFWVNGQGREDGKPYWGLFPIYGRIPRLVFIEDVRWTLFPLYLHYQTSAKIPIERDYILWPFFSLKHDEDVSRWGLWPIFGTKYEKDVSSRYAFWPIWTERIYHSEVKNGHAWMLFPLAQRIDADSEQGFGVLPPFFFYSRTTQGAKLVRFPWPFERYTDPNEDTWRFWRLWGRTHRGTRKGWWFLHPILTSQQQVTDNVRTSRFRFFPFYASDRDGVSDIHGQWRERSHYWRIWPFVSQASSENAGLERKALVLFPLRDTPSVDRNWAPFWTIYRADREPQHNTTHHELFWGLIKWQTHLHPQDPSFTSTKEMN